MRRRDHSITEKQVELLIREGEGLSVEFKERYTPRIDQDMVAFANARGGMLLLGVREIIGDVATKMRYSNSAVHIN